MRPEAVPTHRKPRLSRHRQLMLLLESPSVVESCLNMMVLCSVRLAYVSYGNRTLSSSITLHIREVEVVFMALLV